MLFTSSAVLFLAAFAVAKPAPSKRAAVAFVDPNTDGGRMLTDADGLDGQAGDLGEPLNVIISGLSSADVLTDAGFLNYAQSIGFSFECLGLHLGGPQSANLGDGNGFVNQTVEYRQDYGDEELGTCLESLIGGNHLRVFRQNGTEANTGALFLAVSQEENVAEGHTIVANGYNLGRNALAATAIAGTTTANGVSYTTVAQNLTTLLPAGTAGVNHDIATDGITTLLTVTIV
ncbi:hypothetical protein FB45DRAFT_835441 [Roridomyces roridus]|uniref:Uncharacterized protein n=1 Tax=Roridomyces roridus TaxID=1738132 RepID=A0AAD7FME8_9AGAR|nr:hypothetical protein FB45DRAFT_835441 [Roridomyces roridus]